jgi:hypothetical protein
MAEKCFQGTHQLDETAVDLKSGNESFRRGKLVGNIKKRPKLCEVKVANQLPAIRRFEIQPIDPRGANDDRK